MKEQLINEIQRKMLPYLNNEQLLQLGSALAEALQGVTVSQEGTETKQGEQDAVSAFIIAKRIEGCSEKTLRYYRKTIESMLSTIAKKASQITTDDLRKYLTTYQTQRKSSKVTIDNIRRILSSFFSWLEDEDFILKSPVRRIHKVKTAKLVKDTYTDEALELMRDNCTTTRDLAIIDLLASSGMRVGEMVMLNREDIDFNERECVVIGKGNKERLVYFDARTKIHLLFYPYQVYINWTPKEEGNILYNDKKFVTLLYQWNNDYFTEYSKVSDAGSYVKGSIYEFIESSEKVVIVVDCENSDPYKLCATLRNLDRQYTKKISSIILFDDVHAASAWRILESFTAIPVEHSPEDHSLSLWKAPLCSRSSDQSHGLPRQGRPGQRR